MHYSAKRGLAITCRLSVMLVDCDQIGWKSWKRIARTISPTPSLFITQQHPPTPRGHGEIMRESKNLTKTLLSLTLVRLCEDMRGTDM